MTASTTQTPTPAPSPATNSDLLGRLRRVGPAEYGIVWITLALFIGLWLSSDVFLTTANLRNIIDQQSLIVIAGSAMTL
ncbi:MAG: hypothetical protein AAF547_14235, partial [Actinomycetota bacterium]